LPHGYCRRHPKLHCESDVKCLLCERFCALPSDLPQLEEMHERFLYLGMGVKANVVASHIHCLGRPVRQVAQSIRPREQAVPSSPSETFST
jgi:hypothetical protein